MKPFHDKMHVRLKNGVEIVNMPLDKEGDACLCSSDSRMLFWSRYSGSCYIEGLVRSDDDSSELDIVEVLSDPPVKRFSDFKPEELKPGMRFIYEVFLHELVVFKCVDEVYIADLVGKRVIKVSDAEDKWRIDFSNYTLISE